MFVFVQCYWPIREQLTAADKKETANQSSAHPATDKNWVGVCGGGSGGAVAVEGAMAMDWVAVMASD